MSKEVGITVSKNDNFSECYTQVVVKAALADYATVKGLNVIRNDVIKPKVIIHPKSIIGFISLKTKDKNAQMVVKTVYNIGQNIFSVVIKIIFDFFNFGNCFFNCKNLVLI